MNFSIVGLPELLSVCDQVTNEQFGCFLEYPDFKNHGLFFSAQPAKLHFKKISFLPTSASLSSCPHSYGLFC